MPATGVFAPVRMLVAVRAMAPVAGKPPNIGDAILAIPLRDRARRSDCGWSPLMRSATTADISDSIAPSIVTVSTEEQQSRDEIEPQGRESESAEARTGCLQISQPIVSTGRRNAKQRAWSRRPAR